MNPNAPPFVPKNPRPPRIPFLDSSELVNISSLALLKMLRHVRSAVPVEVMGLMLGEFIDEYSVHVVDAFALPQISTGASIEAVDTVFLGNMLDMLKQTGRFEMVVGWYHSHPGFGCWLSAVDITTQLYFQSRHSRAVAVVLDPIQSVKGKVVIDAFRLVDELSIDAFRFIDYKLSIKYRDRVEPRQKTSNLGSLDDPSVEVRGARKPLTVKGLSHLYYSLLLSYRKNKLEEKMLLSLKKKKHTDGLILLWFDAHSKTNEQIAQEMANLAVEYNKSVQEEGKLPLKKFRMAKIGKLDAKKRLEDHVSNLLSSNIVQVLGMMLNTVIF